MEHTIYTVYRWQYEWDAKEIEEEFGKRLSKNDVAGMIWDITWLDYNTVGKFDNLWDAQSFQDSLPVFTYVKDGKLVVNFAWTESELYDDDVSDVLYKDMIDDINGTPMVFVETIETEDINCYGYDFERGN